MLMNQTPSPRGATRRGGVATFTAIVGLALFLTGCGAGTVLTAAGVSGGGGSSTTVVAASDPVVTSVQVTESRTSPAKITFSLIDAESDPVDVKLFFEMGGVTGEIVLVGGSLTQLATSPSPGTEHEFLWDFASQLGTAEFQPDAKVIVRLLGVTGAPEAQPLVGSFKLGNDAAVIVDALAPTTAEVSGNVDVTFSVADSSSDPVSIRVEFRIAGETNWQLARPAGTPATEPTPVYARINVVTTPVAAVTTFVWDTLALSQLPGREVDVQLRFRADDAIHTGEFRETTLFHVDNNLPPIAILDAGSVLTNSDRKRGIPVPFSIIDPEGDDVLVVMQWRRSGEGFPDLDADPVVMSTILADADPAQRRALQIAEELPIVFEGRPVASPLADPEGKKLRLPELASSAAGIRPTALAGRALEILRASTVAEPIGSTWTLPNPLVGPVAALPVGNGETARVLDSASPGIWRLREIRLGTGAVIGNEITGVGDPTAMDYEPGATSVLIATSQAGNWSLDRVNLLTGDVTTLHAPVDPGVVQGVTSLGTDASLVTVGSALMRVNHVTPPPPFVQVVALRNDLQTPRGVIVDPLDTNRVYVAEQSGGPAAAGRVIALELDSYGRPPVVQVMGTLAGFPQPSAIALTRSGTRLLVVTDSASVGCVRELRGVDIGGAQHGEVFTITCFADDPTSLATGADGLCLLTLPSNDLAVGGGVEQTRTIGIDGFEPTTQVVTVTAAFDPPLATATARRWRLGRPANPVKGSTGVFVWDTRGAPVGEGSAFLKMTPYDADRGGASEFTVSKQIKTADLLTIGDSFGTAGASSVEAADLDGDGDLDLVSANRAGSNVTIFFQASPGVYAATPDLTLGNASTTNGATSVEAADLDGDGDLDLVSANSTGSNVTIFFQTSPGVYAATPDLTLGNALTTNGAASIEAADLDGDGDLDLVSANSAGSNVTIFFQTSPGVYAATPDLTLGDASTTTAAASVRAGDLDGDGDLDLVSANRNSSNLTIFFQTSPGVFATTPDLTLGDASTTSGATFVEAADLDGDGDLDLVSANSTGDNLTVFFQTGPGVFAVTPVLMLGDSFTTIRPAAVEAADLDGDGDLDLVSANNSPPPNLTVFFQTSPGVFAATPDLKFSSTTGPAVAVEAADLDGDGDLDFVSANGFGDNLTVFFHPSPGAFAATPDLTLGDAFATDQPLAVEVADLDGDGDLDLVSANELSDNLTVFFQTSSGVFATTPDLTLGNSSTTNGAQSVKAADLDGDGDLDLVSANRLRNNLTIFFQTGPGVFAAAPDLSLGDFATTPGPFFVEAADLDGDGDLDLVSANFLGDNLTVFFQTSAGVFATTPDLTLGDFFTTGGANSVKAADLDGDGDLDLVSTNATDMTIFFQTSPGVYAATPDLTLGNGSQSVQAADLDGDGDLDLVSANDFSDNLTVFFQMSPGVFAAAPDLTLGDSLTTDNPSAVEAADVDGDGDLDLVSANRLGHNLTVFLQASPGVFAATPNFTIGNSTATNGPRSLKAVDLDGDGDLDLVSANSLGSNLTVFYGSH